MWIAALAVVFSATASVAAFSGVGLSTTTTTRAIAGNKSLLAKDYAMTVTTPTSTSNTPLGNSRFHSASHGRFSRKSVSASSSALAMISRQSMEQLGVFLGIMTVLQRRKLWMLICHQWAYIQTLSRSNQLLTVVAFSTTVYAGIMRPFWSWYKNSSSSLQEEDADDKKETNIASE
jgi:hypothetical protein